MAEDSLIIGAARVQISGHEKYNTEDLNSVDHAP